jgi:hypothetical protein
LDEHFDFLYELYRLNFPNQFFILKYKDKIDMFNCIEKNGNKNGYLVCHSILFRGDTFAAIGAAPNRVVQ